MGEWGSQPSLNESKIYTFTIVHIGFGEREGKTPYALVIVESANGDKVTAILEDIPDLNKVEIGAQVRLKRTDQKLGQIYTLI